MYMEYGIKYQDVNWVTRYFKRKTYTFWGEVGVAKMLKGQCD